RSVSHTLERFRAQKHHLSCAHTKARARGPERLSLPPRAKGPPEASRPQAPPGAGKPGRFSWTEYTAFCPPVQAAGRGQSVTGLKKEGKTKLRFLTTGARPSTMGAGGPGDRKSTRLNSSHFSIAYSVFFFVL